jgi:XkdW protein
VIDEALRHAFPDFKQGDWSLRDDGDGPYIAAWRRVEPQPTPEEIEGYIADYKEAAAAVAYRLERMADYVAEIPEGPPGGIVAGFGDSIDALQQQVAIIDEAVRGLVADLPKAPAYDRFAKRVGAIKARHPKPSEDGQ